MLSSITEQTTCLFEPQTLPLTVNLNREEVYRFLGYPEGTIPPKRILQKVNFLMEETKQLVNPIGTYRSLHCRDAAHFGLPPSDTGQIVLGLVTVGSEIEERANHYKNENSITYALIMEAIGSSAAEEAADRLTAIIMQNSHQPKNHDNGREITTKTPCRISPGYGNWPVTAQKEIFGFLPADEVGIKLTSSSLMIPRKSISFALWPSAKVPSIVQSGCKNCQLKRCLYRRRCD